MIDSLHKNIMYYLVVNTEPQWNLKKGNGLDTMVPRNFTEKVLPTKDPGD